MLVNALTIALLVLGAILLAITVTFSGMGDVPGRLEYRASRFFLSPGVVSLAILAVYLALGPGPPEVHAGSSEPMDGTFPPFFVSRPVLAKKGFALTKKQKFG